MKSPTFQWNTYTHALLTWTSTMDCFSWSLPAGRNGSCPMEINDTGSICNNCYAQQGRYLFPTVRRAQEARFALLKSDPSATLSRIRNFILTNNLPYFRVHDSGDFHNLHMIYLWMDVAASCPLTHFWFPTRGWVYPRWVPALAELNALPNTSVRPSAIHFGDEPPVIHGLSHGTVSLNHGLPGILNCPKSLNHTSCATESCRTCWSKEGYVNYIPHGHEITDRERSLRTTPLTIGAT